jgi:hypothetical protein
MKTTVYNFIDWLYAFALSVAIATFIIPYLDADWSIVSETAHMSFFMRYIYTSAFIVGAIMHLLTHFALPPQNFLF